jgi:hypothetical protein
VQQLAPWPDIKPGEAVVIWQRAKMVASGRADIVAADRSMIWVHLDNGMGRALFLRSDGITLHKPARLSEPGTPTG